MNKLCTICGSAFLHWNNLNAQRANMGCSPKCKKALKLRRQKERRIEQRVTRLRRQKLEEVKLDLFKRPASRQSRIARNRLVAARRKWASVRKAHA